MDMNEEARGMANKPFFSDNVLIEYIPPYIPSVETIYKDHIFKLVTFILKETTAALKFEIATTSQTSNMYFKSKTMRDVNILAFLNEIEEYYKYKIKNPLVDVGLWLEKKYEIFVCPDIKDLSNLDNKVEETIRKRKRLRYYCDICDNLQLIEHLYQYYQHFKTQQHIMSQQKLNLDPSMLLQETTCYECQLMTYSTMERESHKHGFSTNIASSENVLPTAAQFLLLKQNYMMTKYREMVSVADKVKEMSSVHSVILMDLSRVMGPSNPCRAYLFGSRQSGLASLNSDLDIYLDLGDLYFGDQNQDADTQAIYVDVTKSHLESCQRVWTKTSSVRFARTPLVKTFHIPTRMRCDISFRNGLGVENTKYLTYMMSLTPNLRGLILMLRVWLARVQLGKKISHYALSIMAVFFMQAHKFLPSLADLRPISASDIPRIVAGWECRYREVSQPPKVCTMSLTELLHSFFTFYGNFDYETQVICPLLGSTINKTAFEKDGEALPIAMEQYRQHAAAIPLKVREDPCHRITKHIMDHPAKELFSHRTPVCVQDPFDLTHNLTKAVCQDTVLKFRTYCSQSAVLCQRALADS